MKKNILMLFLVTILMSVTLFAGIEIGKTKTYHICTNEATRDYAFEAYCDSIWFADRDYYLDVLTETDEYQLYVEAHGSWWHNEN